MLDFRIYTFLEVCKHMNITRAACALNITQPAVTQHIQYLEKNYGVKFFSYKSKKLYLTKAGKMFLNYVTALNHDDIKFREEISNIETNAKKLNIGATLTVGEYFMPDKIKKYMNQNKNSDIKMVVANTNVLLEYLNEGAIDFAVIEGYFPKNEYDFITVSAENYIGICSKKSRLWGKKVSLDDLLDYCIIVREKGSGSRELIEKYLESKNLSFSDFKNIIEISNINSIKKLVAENIGIAFLYEIVVREKDDAEGVERIDIDGFSIKHDFTMIWRKNSKYKKYYYEIFEKFMK